MSIRQFVYFLAGFALISTSITAFAQGKPDLSHPLTPAEQIREINETIAILSAQLGEVEVRAKIAAKNDELRKLQAGPTPAATPNGGIPSQSTQTIEEAPYVRAIEGVDGRLKATLMLRSGTGLQIVKEGDKYGAWTVKSISISSVSLSRGKEVITLAFGTSPESETQPAGPFATLPTGAPGQQSPFVSSPLRP